MSRSHPTRRDFLRNATGTLAATSLLGPAIVQAASGNELLQVASVGVGGMIGRHDLANITGSPRVRLAAMCDVDAEYLKAATEEFPGTKNFSDYRRMFDEIADDIDAVMISTPDHMHGPIASAAMELGKHVYCQKPLAHNLFECRAMQDMAAKNKQLVTQMGTQAHSHAAYRTGVAMLQSGAIGKVREVHMWVAKSWDGPASGRPDRTDPVPEHFDWNLWLGSAPERPYAEKTYHPHEWRRWTDFGTGTLGDMGCHIFDPVFSCLELGAPTKAISRGPKCHEETYSPDTDVVYHFAGTRFTDGQITCRWTDGTNGSRPDISRAQLPEGVELPSNGLFMVGEKGVMVLPHIDMPRFYSQGKPMEISIEELPSKNHYHEWADVCRGEGQVTTPFSYGCAVTEAVLVGTIATRFPGEELAWNSADLTFNYDAANQLVRREYRPGWEL
ncbi:MAG: Gfo/Idh/MocA family oxidoreductase [Planctomycetes bacterium]|nr:Gfo/Idh/MocA family oxidoreductase [Planctomycetota bacterium]